MNDQLWGWVLSALGLVGFWLAGKKIWWAWYVNLLNQLVWALYAILTAQWGFLVGVVFYTFIFAKNARMWTLEHRAESKEKELK